MTGPRVSVREAASADAESIADVHAASIRELGSDEYEDRQLRAWLSNVHPERYPLEEPGFLIVVAEREHGADSGAGDDTAPDAGSNTDTADGIVGFGLLDCKPSDRDESTGEIGAVYVHPDHAREGVGRTILAALESAAREEGLETLVLTASRNAIDFYRDRAYEGIETVSLEMEEGVELECLRMQRTIQSA
ncbi:GNAT family N-acetyltransferase [Natronorubrum sp. JWXQ-INN-674]|uniref:GNAT family N-acetyltransferase n=1 Tax=Natronorubrum halalkaliphilum TaxID=2691917 RepID=A0A6B0VLE8_9EURY|nr:GNAT family N-acetyltransferase [Natronorubrum halalkaliphilum]MXV61399.1 GNAT family N-acetyltransferase [Natronorubrum halalkaliphilum]